MAILGDAIRFVVLGIIALAVFTAGLFIFGRWYGAWSGEAWYGVSDGICNIAVIPISGYITTTDAPASEEEGDEEGGEYATISADYVSAYARAIESDPYILGALARVDSYGGSPAGSSIIMNTIRRLSVPTVGLIREAGLSGGYSAAIGADHVIAGEYSDVGSIGVTMSYLENVERNEKEGYAFVQISSGAFKDAGNPNKALTAEERALYERDVKIYHDLFVKEVAEARGLRVEDVDALADGSALPGRLALEKGLIDELGDQETARDWFAATLGMSREDVIFCE